MARTVALKWLEILRQRHRVGIGRENLPAQNLPVCCRVMGIGADGKLKISGRGSAWLERLVRDQGESKFSFHAEY